MNAQPANDRPQVMAPDAEHRLPTMIPRAAPFDTGAFDVPHASPFVCDLRITRAQLGTVIEHVSNIEYVRWLGDVSPKGLGNGAGFMVNYLYDLENVVANHEAHVKHGTIFAAHRVRTLRPAGSPPGGRTAGSPEKSGA